MGEKQNITFQFSLIYFISKNKSRRQLPLPRAPFASYFNPETMRSLLYTVAAVAILSQVDASCENPKVQASSYTSSDSQVLTHIPFITEFTLSCSNGASNIPLYASVKGALSPVQQTPDGKKYQIAWTEEVKDAKAGDHEINFYDESGYSALKRVLERGEDAIGVKPLVTIVVNHPGAYSGPWINSEHTAAILSAVVLYFAYSSKAKLLA